MKDKIVQNDDALGKKRLLRLFTLPPEQQWTYEQIGAKKVYDPSDLRERRVTLTDLCLGHR